MSSADLKNFMKALESVKQDYTCGVCFEFCKDPVTLSKCFHIICSAHFEGLKRKRCPKCDTPLEGCTTFTDERLGSSIESAKELNKIFETYKNKEISTKSTRASKSKFSKKNVEIVDKDSAEPDVGTNKVALSDKTNQSKLELNKSTLNTSMLSSGSRIKTIEKRNKKGETMLHIACRLGKVDSITELLNQGANTNTKDNAGWTPLHEVVQSGRTDLVRLLLQHNTLINVPGPSNETPLHEAVRYNHKDIVEELVKNGANMNARNCKGETPFQLASSEMKNVLLAAADHVIMTQSVNISRIAALYAELDGEDIRVFCVSQFRTVHNKLKTLAKCHKNMHIEVKFTANVTHLIVDAEDNGVCQSSVDVLQAVTNALWILQSQWITKSTEDKIESFESYEVTGIGTTTYQGPKNARYNKYKQLPGIFDGCHFYLHNFKGKYEVSKNLVLTKAILSKFITDAGGQNLVRAPNPELIPERERLVPYHARNGGKLVNCSHYIVFRDVYQPMFNMQHLKALPIGWLIECLEKYELCEPW